MPAQSRQYWFRAARLIWLLKEGKVVTRRMLAAEFEISVSSVQRLIDSLIEDHRAPIVYDSTKASYRLEDPHWDIPSIPLSADEIAALSLANALVTHRFPAQFSGAIQSFVDKLRVELDRFPDGSVLLESVTATEPSWCRVDHHILRTVVKGLALRRKLSMGYRSPWQGRRTERTVEPKHLLLYNGTFYLVAFCELRQAIRLFHVSFIEDIALTEAACERPAIHLDEIMDAHGIIIGRDIMEVTVRLTGPDAQRARVELWHREQDDTWDEEHLVLVRKFPVRGTYEVLHRVLSYGSALEVLAPDSLRAQVKEQIRQMAGLYEIGLGGR